MRARRMSSSAWVTLLGSRGSALHVHRFRQIPIVHSAYASSNTPPSEVSLPPSNAAVAFLRRSLETKNPLRDRRSQRVWLKAFFAWLQDWLRHPFSYYKAIA